VCGVTSRGTTAASACASTHRSSTPSWAGRAAWTCTVWPQGWRLGCMQPQTPPWRCVRHCHFVLGESCCAAFCQLGGGAGGACWCSVCREGRVGGTLRSVWCHGWRLGGMQLQRIPSRRQRLCLCPENHVGVSGGGGACGCGACRTSLVRTFSNVALRPEAGPRAAARPLPCSLRHHERMFQIIDGTPNLPRAALQCLARSAAHVHRMICPCAWLDWI
jgi:hypothetical protein